MWPFCTGTNTAAIKFSSIDGKCGAAASRIDSDGITITSVCSGGENASAYNLLFADRILHGTTISVCD